jgi:hypothetical protein
MRVRTLTGMAAVALTLGTTGFASAAEPLPPPPDGEGTIFICKNGELTERRPTEEDLKRIRERLADRGWDGGRVRVGIDKDGHVEVLPGPDGPGSGDVRFERRGDGRPPACAAPER